MLLDTKRLKLILVDHNILAEAQKHVDTAVTEILGEYICVYLWSDLCGECCGLNVFLV